MCTLSARFTHSIGNVNRELRAQWKWQSGWSARSVARMAECGSTGNHLLENELLATGDGSTAAMPTTQQWHYVCFHHFSAQINISKLIKNFRWNWRMQRPGHVCVSHSFDSPFVVHGSAYASGYGGTANVMLMLMLMLMHAPLAIRHPQNESSTTTER